MWTFSQWARMKNNKSLACCKKSSIQRWKKKKTKNKIVSSSCFMFAQTNAIFAPFLQNGHKRYFVPIYFRFVWFHSRGFSFAIVQVCEMWLCWMTMNEVWLPFESSLINSFFQMISGVKIEWTNDRVCAFECNFVRFDWKLHHKSLVAYTHIDHIHTINILFVLFC